MQISWSRECGRLLHKNPIMSAKVWIQTWRTDYLKSGFLYALYFYVIGFPFRLPWKLACFACPKIFFN